MRAPCALLFLAVMVGCTPLSAGPQLAGAADVVTPDAAVDADAVDATTPADAPDDRVAEDVPSDVSTVGGPRITGAFVSSGATSARLTGGFVWHGGGASRIEGWLR
ncbi:MAG: hypothetical protein U0326_02200 [Polyangiales bacterium]